MSATIRNPEKNFLDLCPNGALHFNAHAIGRDAWSQPATFPGEMNAALTQFFYKILLDSSLWPCNQLLRAQFSLTGIITFSISFYGLAMSALRSGNPDFIYDSSKLVVTRGLDEDYPLKSRANYFKQAAKDYITTYLQKVFFRFLNIFHPRLKISLMSHDIYKQVYTKRFRRYDGVTRVFKSEPSPAHRAQIKEISQRIIHFSCKTAEEVYSITLDQAHREALFDIIFSQILRSHSDLESYKKFFRGISFNFYEKSLSRYHAALIGLACQSRGGEVYASFHGPCLTTNEPDIITLMNCDVFSGVTSGFTQDARDVSLLIPEDLRKQEIIDLDLRNYYQSYLSARKACGKNCRVAIMGRQVVMRQSAFNMLEFPYYIDVEVRLARLLLEAGYEVTYKAHPESNWQNFDILFDPRVKIDYQSFEKKIEDYDAVFFHFLASTTFVHAMGSHLNIYYLADGWHDKKLFPPRLQKLCETYCNPLKASLGSSGWVEWDVEKIKYAFENPKPFDPEERIRNWFNLVDGAQDLV
ncbi:MAG: hypothetical protein L6Q57_06445 [Alphaproteobacteria bacterium]|nr:hypothetical protein [Alphaproteobacteria bacterium]